MQINEALWESWDKDMGVGRASWNGISGAFLGRVDQKKKGGGPSLDGIAGIQGIFLFYCSIRNTVFRGLFAIFTGDYTPEVCTSFIGCAATTARGALQIGMIFLKIFFFWFLREDLLIYSPIF